MHCLIASHSLSIKALNTPQKNANTEREGEKKQKKEDDTEFGVKNEKSPLYPQTTPPMGSILSLNFFR